MTIETPWGPAQHVTEIAPGIVSYSTASHGGIHLSDERVAEMPAALQEFVPFGGRQSGPGRWFEEDCDWSVVALAFPQFFTDGDVQAAHATLKGYRPKVFEAFAKETEVRDAAQPVENGTDQTQQADSGDGLRLAFQPGSICVSLGASEALKGSNQLAVILSRHLAGDWGDVSADDKKANDYALTHGERLLSVYKVNGEKLWVLTEADREMTTVMTPGEY